MPNSRPPKICDYEGSNYRTEFWEGRGREYEDRVERVALRRMLPPDGGRRLLELGAGFGRLTSEYDAYDQVVLLDYSLSQLQFAQEHYGRDPRFIYVAADAYKLPFRPGVFDAATMIRVIHHMAHVHTVLEQVRFVLAPGTTFILEHANKQNIKAMMRYAMRQQEWSPYDREPVEFVELNFDFHPEYIIRHLKTAGFMPKQRVPVSFFRLEMAKEVLPTDLLVSIDSLLQNSGVMLTPSIFIKSITNNKGTDHVATTTGDNLFICPETGAELVREGDVLVNKQDNLRYAVRDGIYDFKAPLEA